MEQPPRRWLLNRDRRGGRSYCTGRDYPPMVAPASLPADYGTPTEVAFKRRPSRRPVLLHGLWACVFGPSTAWILSTFIGSAGVPAGGSWNNPHGSGFSPTTGAEAGSYRTGSDYPPMVAPASLPADYGARTEVALKRRPARRPVLLWVIILILQHRPIRTPQFPAIFSVGCSECKLLSQLVHVRL
jgi:hypothetical protein